MSELWNILIKVRTDILDEEKILIVLSPVQMSEMLQVQITYWKIMSCVAILSSTVSKNKLIYLVLSDPKASNIF